MNTINYSNQGAKRNNYDAQKLGRHSLINNNYESQNNISFQSKSNSYKPLGKRLREGFVKALLWSIPTFAAILFLVNKTKP
jgi:hypothetical protein